ncbi:hypothetical protein PMG11_09936 [Penicillium brasilianum]|uniref:Uncharacterized protein n=1 Tax=Penicillium brasilianum TaxID=104259 RepID=A0A0F7TZL5_PENBI|nr:hypothetical protein PMG11_09936 [Penicillium brasilianum]
MASNRASAKALGLTEKEMTVLLYGILCPSPNGSRSPVHYEKLARELGYTYFSIKVVYGNARRKLVRETGITPATRGSAPDSSGGCAVDLGGTASAAADEEEKGQTSKRQKVRRTTRKRNASEMDDGRE